MSRTQKYISLLLERLPKYELRSYEHQISLDRIRDRISGTADINAELHSLYQVQNCADFALSLMWIADKVEKDATKEESTIDEETLVFSKFRQAVGDVSPGGDESPQAGTSFNLPGSQDFGSASESSVKSEIDFSSPPDSSSFSTPEPQIDSIFGAMAQGPDLSQPPGGSSTMGSEQELGFAALLEKFLEAVQSGNDDRTTLLSNIINECHAVLAASNTSEDYKHFCTLLTEFLNYISVNQFMDDVRVMNMLSNIQDPFSQWAHSSSESRSSFMNSVIDILRDFKTMFE
jgi:hypothetical protein